jgi:hypothetical protein
MKNKIFLGGTCNDSIWRDDLIKALQVDYFNPVVEDWTPKCQEIERAEKEVACNIHLYVITSDMIGVFSIAEVIDSVHQRNKRTYLHVISNGFEEGQIRSLQAVVDLVNIRGGVAYIDNELLRTARIMNDSFSTFRPD